MDLSQAASYFDQTTFADIYTPANTFLGQFNLFDDSMRDGLSIERRIISTDVGVTIPTRRAISTTGSIWIVGDNQDDHFQGEIVRRKYVAHKAIQLVNINKFSDVLSGVSNTNTAWTSQVWLKSLKEENISSTVFNQYNFYFATGENVVINDIIVYGLKYHIVRGVYNSAGGMLVAVVDELPEPVVVSADISNQEYDPIQDIYISSPQNVTAMMIRWQSHYLFLEKEVAKYKAGDVIVIVLKEAITTSILDGVTVDGEVITVDAVDVNVAISSAAMVVAGSKVAVNGIDYIVDTIIDEGLTYALKVNRS